MSSDKCMWRDYSNGGPPGRHSGRSCSSRPVAERAKRDSKYMLHAMRVSAVGPLVQLFYDLLRCAIEQGPREKLQLDNSGQSRQPHVSVDLRSQGVGLQVACTLGLRGPRMYLMSQLHKDQVTLKWVPVPDAI